MEYPIIIRATQEPRSELFDKHLGSEPNKGESEDEFFKYLKNKNLPVFINQFINPYAPDILFLDKKLMLLIDIEIDEPYSKSGVLTHYFGNEFDNKRNLFLSKIGIHIIRFSEKQVICFVNVCCLIIDLFIKSLKEPKYEFTLEFWRKKISEPQWTKKKSELLFHNKARDLYPFDIIFEKESKNILKIDKPMNHFTDKVLREISINDIIEIPILINRIKNQSTNEVGFSYYGLHFSNSEYAVCKQENTTVRLVMKCDFEYPFFEKHFSERILFNDKSYECMPFIIVKSGPNNYSRDVKFIQ